MYLGRASRIGTLSRGLPPAGVAAGKFPGCVELFRMGLVVNATRRRHGDRADANSRVHGAGAVREHLEWIDIEFQDVRTRLNQR
jgi:hypothetical protein